MKTLAKLPVTIVTGFLGAGKTTLSRGILRGLGHAGSVKSPTFTLVEPYEIGELRAYHSTCTGSPMRRNWSSSASADYFDGSALCLIEWPDARCGRFANRRSGHYH